MRRASKILSVLVLAAVVVYVLFTIVFPEVERRLEQDPTLGSPAVTAQAVRVPS